MRRLLPLLLAFATPAWAEAPSLAGTRLALQVEASVARAPDLVTVAAGVTTQAASAAEAIRGNAARMAAVIAALNKAGIAERDVQTSAISLAAQYRYGDNQPPTLTGYQATNRVTVRLHGVAATGAVLDSLVAAGANQIEGPTFSVEHPEAALDEARERAVATARARADLYARAAGLHVARIVSLSEADAATPVVRPMAMMAMRKEGPATTPVEAGEQTLTVSLQAVFELD